MLSSPLWSKLIGPLTWGRLGRSLLFIYGAIALYAFFFSDRLIFQPPPASYVANANLIKIPSDEGVAIAATYLRNPKARYTLLYSHGNAEDLGYIYPILQDLQAAGFSVFSYDYRSYGLSEGRASEGNAYRDIRAAYRYLTETLKVPPEQIILHGRSVGSGPSVDLAREVPVAGLIVESAFTSAFVVMTQVPLFPFDKFSNLAKIRRVECPVLVIHGTEDELIPLRHGERLLAEAPGPTQFLWVEGAGHNDLVAVAGDRYWKAIQAFAATLPTP